MVYEVLPDDGVAATVGAATPEAVRPEVEVPSEAMEGRYEELLMNEGSAASSLLSSSPLDPKTNHEGK